VTAIFDDIGINEALDDTFLRESLREASGKLAGIWYWSVSAGHRRRSC
jgi:hypothetical protein